MKKIIYIEDNFISPSQCQEIINYTNESLGIMTAVGHSEDTIPTFEPQEDYMILLNIMQDKMKY